MSTESTEMDQRIRSAAGRPAADDQDQAELAEQAAEAAGLPKSLAAHLSGDTAEELSADAEQLAGDLGLTENPELAQQLREASEVATTNQTDQTQTPAE